MAYRDDSYYISRITGYSDMTALAGLINKHKTLAYNIALRITRNKEDAEEIAQDAFVKVYQSLHTFKGDSKFSTWLYKIVYHLSLTRIRKKDLFDGSSDDDNFSEPDDEAAFDALSTLKIKERNKFVSNAINKLDDNDQLIVTLFYMNELSIDEIHDITGMTESNIKVRLFRSRKKLMSILEKDLQGELSSIW